MHVCASALEKPIARFVALAFQPPPRPPITTLLLSPRLVAPRLCPARALFGTSSTQMSKRPASDAFSAAGPGQPLAASTSSPPKKSPKLADVFAAAAASKTAFWRDRVSPHCPHGVHGSPKGSLKVAAFDLDGTLIKVKSGAKASRTSGGRSRR